MCLRQRGRTALQRTELHARRLEGGRVGGVHVLPGDATLQRAEVSRVQRRLDVLRDGGGHLWHRRLLALLLIGQLWQRAAAQAAELVDVGGALLPTLLPLRWRMLLLMVLLLVELKAFKVWEIFAGSPISVIIRAFQRLALFAQSRVLAIVRS